MFSHIGHKIIAVVGIIVTVGLIGTGIFYTDHQEESILAQNQRTMSKLTESIIQGLQTVMLAGYANIAQEFADRLKNVPEVVDFRIMRTNGLEAFRDNKTIDEVNERRGEEEFLPRLTEKQIPVLASTHPELNKTVETQDLVSYYEISSEGERFLTFLAPIKNDKACHNCHGKNPPIRGVLKLTTSLDPVEKDIRETWIQSFFVVGIAITFTIIITGILIRRSVVSPIDSVTAAMVRASNGDLTQEVPILGRDELSRMAGSFNRMTKQLLKTYTGLQTEQDKLSTIILSAREGIVVTDSTGNVVLINPAAEQLLGKDMAQVVNEGFLNLFDAPDHMESWLQSTEESQEPEIVHFNNLILSVYAATIRSSEGNVIGSAALIRDVTEEKRLEQELLKLSNTDALTSLFNRRYLDQTLESELSRAVRYESPLSILMFDVDHFKKFNDEHGHDQGDRVLQAIAQQMRKTVRDIDHPCRYGGEEFLIILPSTPHHGAMALAERLRENVEAMVVDGLKVTISIGVASIPPFEGSSAQMVEKADEALYKAKENGRNQVTSAHDHF